LLYCHHWGILWAAPLSLIKSLEMFGCYVADDDFMLINRWLLADVETEGDPIENLYQSIFTPLN